MEPKLTNTAGLKTYSRSKCWKVSNPMDNNEPLTTKEAVKFLLQGSLKRRVCRFCLTTTTSLSELDEILEVANSGAIFQVTIRDMVASFYPFQVSDDANFPNKICGKCLDRTINCYLFTQQCERAERAMRNCLIDVSEKFDKLDPLERVKRRGRQKLNPNHNIIHVEHKNVINYADLIINIVNSGSSLVTCNDDAEINELECPKCWQVFANIESLVNHEKIHPQSMWYNCKFCGSSFVKLPHYKKHMKQSHIKAKNNKTNTDKQHFQCNECGTACEELENYLQHIEKHKFKNVLEHLVEKKMDSLCGVCLDKGDSMTRLNETLSIHGGYPELSGEMTVATVLTATIPEKSHKYDEFHVSKEANRVAITKRIAKTAGKTNTKPNESNKANTKPNEINKANTKPTEINKANTKPNEINKANTKSDDAALKLTVTYNTFRFSNPIKVSNDLVQNADETDCSTIEKNARSVDISALHVGVQEKFETGVGFPFSFSNPINILDDSCLVRDGVQVQTARASTVKQTDGNEIEPSDMSPTPILCLTCSILKNAKCEKCIEKTSIYNEGIVKTNMENETGQLKSCKMCWVFGKVGQCNYCKEQTDDDKNIQNKDISDPQQTNMVIPNQQTDDESAKTVASHKENIEHKNLTNQQNLEPKKINEIPKLIVEPDEDKPTRKRKIESEEANSIPKRNIEPDSPPVIQSLQDVQPERVSPIPKALVERDKVNPTFKTKLDSEEVVPSRKRKIDPVIEVSIVKRSKWQCEICLTNNDNRERCYCCGERKTKDNPTKFSFNTVKCDYTPKRSNNKSEAAKNDNIIAVSNEGNEPADHSKDNKQEENKVEGLKNDLIPNISLPSTEAVVINTANVVKEDTNQIKLQNEEQMDVNFDDGNLGKIVGNVAKFDSNIVKLEGNVSKFGNVIGNFGKIDSNIGKAPVMPNVNFNFGTCTAFTPPMPSFTPPVMQSFSPMPAMTPTQLPSLSFNIGAQDSKPRKILKNMRHRRERQVKK